MSILMDRSKRARVSMTGDGECLESFEVCGVVPALVALARRRAVGLEKVGVVDILTQHTIYIGYVGAVPVAGHLHVGNYALPYIAPELINGLLIVAQRTTKPSAPISAVHVHMSPASTFIPSGRYLSLE